MPQAPSQEATRNEKPEKAPENSAISKAQDYSLKRWAALTRYLDHGEIPLDNDQVENRIRPWALGCKTGYSLAPYVVLNERRL